MTSELRGTIARGSMANWIAFVAMAFLISGLAGVFTTYALPIPMNRLLAREAAFDAAVRAVREPNAETALAALAPGLGESAAAIQNGTGPLLDRIESERAVMRQHFRDEEEATALRLRWLSAVVNMAGAMFVIGILGSALRGAR